ncbi:endonuclease III [Actinomyces naeslundii]|uniref:endonuclease III n=1 Tax=Actinomyces naeslundii TaxID=1655 RepID=UPI00096F1021|nr:endonuclease III [Actinomyces naeslundii]OMG09265.1 endonuclease III [Actinomyces naeslundii]
MAVSGGRSGLSRTRARTRAPVALVVLPMRSRREDVVRRAVSSEVAAADAVPEVSEVPTMADPAWRAGAVDDELMALYPDAACALEHDGPFQLLVATVLSAQTTDARVNTVTPELFERYSDAAALGAARREDLEAILRPLGFQQAKAGHLLGIGQALDERFGGRVPRSREELVSLPGVGRKTANVVLGNAFGQPAITVDTHVGRLSRRLGWTTSKDPVRVEKDIAALWEPWRWTDGCHRLIEHGRRVCSARSPRCGECVLLEAGLCPQVGV